MLLEASAGGAAVEDDAKPVPMATRLLPVPWARPRPMGEYV